MSKNIYIITGPSGAGKSSISGELLRNRPNLKKVVTCTTRKIRDGETDGVSYHFLDQETFQRLIKNGEMFEWDEHYNNYYGSRTSDIESIMSEGNDVLFVVDVAGAKTIKEAFPQAIMIFIQAETPEQLLERLQKRDGGETTGLEERLKSTKEEMCFANSADHRIVNVEGKLDETVEQISVIMGSLD